MSWSLKIVIAVWWNKDTNIYSIAGCNQNGDQAVLISCFKSEQSEIKLESTNLNFKTKKCTVSILDSNNDIANFDNIKIIISVITLLEIVT